MFSKSKWRFVHSYFRSIKIMIFIQMNLQLHSGPWCFATKITYIDIAVDIGKWHGIPLTLHLHVSVLSPDLGHHHLAAQDTTPEQFYCSQIIVFRACQAALSSNEVVFILIANLQI